MTSADRDDRRLLLHAALDDELDAAKMIDVERMLAADPELSAEYARLKALREAVRSAAPREEPPAVLRARVLELISESPTPQRGTKTRNWGAAPSWPAFFAAIAATVVATLGLDQLVATRGAPDVVTRAIVAAHMRAQIASQPVDVASSDRHTVKPWLVGKLPIAPSVVDLAGLGFPLLGARIDIVAGAGAPTLVYKRREHLISMTELRANIGDFPTAPQRRTLEGYSIVQWSDADRAYEAVSELAPTELDIFVVAFRQAMARERGDAVAPENMK
jgi:anti-sigma factor RsiW